MRGTSVGNDGNPGNRGGDWGQAASSGGSGGAAITKKQIIMNNLQRNGSVDDNVKGNIANI